jgi:hypothetical protein
MVESKGRLLLDRNEKRATTSPCRDRLGSHYYGILRACSEAYRPPKKSVEPPRLARGPRVCGSRVVGICPRGVDSSQQRPSSALSFIFYCLAFAARWPGADGLLRRSAFCRHSSRFLAFELHRVVYPTVSTSDRTRSERDLACVLFGRAKGPFTTGGMHWFSRDSGGFRRGSRDAMILH